MDSRGVKVEYDNKMKLLQFHEVVSRLDANQSERHILNFLIKVGVGCYIKVPPKKKVYVDIYNQNPNRKAPERNTEKNPISAAFEMNMDEDFVGRLYREKDREQFCHPIKLDDPYLLRIDEQDLQILKRNGAIRPILFNGALNANLEAYHFTHENGFYDTLFYCPFELQRFAVTSTEEYIDTRKKYIFSERIEIAPSDIVIFETDFHKIKSVYFDENIKEALRVPNQYLTVLNFVAFEYYHGNAEKEYNSGKVKELLENEFSKYNLRTPGSRLLSDMATIINRTYNANQGRHSGGKVVTKIELPIGIEHDRNQLCFSRQLILANYLAQYACKGVNKRQELECEAIKYGLSKSLAEMVVKLITQKPS